MQISLSLLKPHGEQLQREYEELVSQLGLHSSSEAQSLSSLIQTKTDELESLIRCLGSGNGRQESEALELQDKFRRLKLELHFLKRKWKRHLCNETRIRRNQEKRLHVSPFAA